MKYIFSRKCSSFLVNLREKFSTFSYKLEINRIWDLKILKLEQKKICDFNINFTKILLKFRNFKWKLGKFSKVW